MSSTLYKEVEAIVDQLGYDFSKFTPQDFVRWVGEIDGTEFKVKPLPLPPGVTGAWVRNQKDNTHHIFYKSELPSLQQTYIVLHEIGHYLLGHEPQTVIMPNDTLKALKNEDIDVDNILLRSTYNSDEEEAADMVGLVIQTRVFNHARQAELAKPIHPFLRDLGLE